MEVGRGRPPTSDSTLVSAPGHRPGRHLTRLRQRRGTAPCENPRRVRNEGVFAVEDAVDADGLVCMSAIGELDHVASESLVGRLGQRKAAGESVRLDLSRLQFIDSSGVRAILVSVREARRDGWHLEVERQLSWQVERVIDVLGVGAMLWPADQSG